MAREATIETAKRRPARGVRVVHAARAARPLVAITCLLALLSSRAVAGTTGRIAGRVLDGGGEPVLGATVAVVGTALGAIADEEGRYTIINIPAGTYDIRVSSIGFNTVVVTGVIVSADNVTPLEIRTASSTIEMKEVEVVATRPVVDVGLTSSRVTLTSEDIEDLPVQNLDDVVNLQAGVVDGHFRGGRLGEVQFQVDGVSVNNVFDNKSSLTLDRSLLEEVQVVSGTFDAEYGQAMSGVVNAVLKRGTEEFQWQAEVFLGDHVYPGREDRRLTDDDLRPGARQNYQFTLSGPTYVGKTLYLLNLRRAISEDFVLGSRRFVPTDSSNFEQNIFRPTGDGESVPLGYKREWSGALKLSNSAIRNLKLSYQVIFDSLTTRRGDYAYRYNPDGLKTQRTLAIAHGFDISHSLRPTTFYELSARHIHFDYKDLAYEDFRDPGYDAAGQPMGDENYEPGTILQGVDPGRYNQKTNMYLAKGSFVSQLDKVHYMKVGGEVQFPRVSFGTPGYIVFTTVDGEPALVRHEDEPPDYPGVRQYHPVIGALFAQDQMDWDPVTVRAGLRFDYFDARSTVPSDPANPANAIEGVPESVPQATTAKFALSPRLGIAYPITTSSAFHFAYGHFRQYPPIGEMFYNADYSKLADLQAGGINYSIFGNPDVEPEKTIQYEFGYKHALTPDLGLDLTLFYKDIRDLLGVEFISTYNAAEYARFKNVDFGDVLGLTLALDRRRVGILSAALDYTWQQARGNTSDPRETATRASAGEDPQPREIPFNWDQRHTLNATVSLSKPDQYTVSAVVRAGSGQPYTPVIESGFGFGLEANSGRKPAAVVVDLRAERNVRVRGLRFATFARVFNLLDSRFFNGFVFTSTGSADYSRFPAVDRITLADPTRYYAPRRIEVGVTLGSMKP